MFLSLYLVQEVMIPLRSPIQFIEFIVPPRMQNAAVNPTEGTTVFFMQELKYLAGYPESVISQVSRLLAENRLGSLLAEKYPRSHDIRTEKALYDFTISIKNKYLRSAQPISKVIYDGKINVVNHALGTHTFVSRVQGAKLKAKHEIRIASIFKETPLDFLRMIVVHELAHLKEKDHNKAFYKLCEYMEPRYHQLEFDMRLFLTYRDSSGQL